MSTAKTRIILDTDPGGDDCFAFLWLLSLVKQGVAELVAVTSVDGNVQVRQTFAAANKLLKLCGFEQIEVGRGVIGGSAGQIEDAGAIHGADGMGNLSHTLPEVTRSFDEARNADDVIIEQLNTHPGDITIIAIGPLTNLAAAERKSPGVLKQAKEIVMMGGAFKVPGNITSEAEFNIIYDVTAANLVFNSCDNLVILPLDVTQQLIFTRESAQKLAEVKPESAIARFILNLCNFMVETALQFRETSGIHGFLVHDAVTLAYLFYPETLWFQRAFVQVETQGDRTIGKTLVDFRHRMKAGANAWVGLEVDSVNLLVSMTADLKYLIQTIPNPIK